MHELKSLFCGSVVYVKEFDEMEVVFLGIRPLKNRQPFLKGAARKENIDEKMLLTLEHKL